MRIKRPQANLAILLLGSGVSTFGNALVLVALLVYLAGFADSARLIGLVQGSAYLPMALFSYLAGAWVDRHSPRAVMIWTDTLRGLAMIAGGLLLAAVPDVGAGGGAGLAVLLPMVFILGTLQSLFIPGVVLLCMDVERQLAASGRHVRVLGLRNAGTHGATLAGNAIGGSLYLLLGLPALLVYSGLGFILSAISEVFLQETSRNKTRSTIEEPGTSRFHVAIPRLVLQRRGRAAQPLDAGHEALLVNSSLQPETDPRPSHPAAFLADLRAVLSTPPVDLYLLVQILIPFLTMIMPSYLGQVLGLPAQALGLVFALLLAGSITAGLSSGIRGRSNKPTAPQPGKAGRQGDSRAGTGDRADASGRPTANHAYLPGLFASLLLAAIAIPGTSLPLPVGALLLVGLGYSLGTLYLNSIEAVQNVSLPGRGGRSHGMLESLSSIVTPASYFLGAVVLGSGALGGDRISAAIWVAGMAGLLIVYSLLRSRVRKGYTTQ